MFQAEEIRKRHQNSDVEKSIEDVIERKIDEKYIITIIKKIQ